MNQRKQIIACLEGYDDTEYKLRLTHTGQTVQQSIAALSKNALFVNYFGNFLEMRPKGILDDGTLTYEISPVDFQDKYSRTYANCTGVIAVGTDRENGENISFLTHQDPYEFLKGKDHHESFVRDLRLRLTEIRERSAPGSIDVVIVGGLYFDYRHKMDYLASLCLLRNEIFSALGICPTVMTGPKVVHYGSDDVAFETKHRRLYLSRPRLDKTAESFCAGELALQEKKWR